MDEIEIEHLQEALSASESGKTCYGHEMAFRRRAADEAISAPVRLAASLLAAVCSFMFKSGKEGNPWGPFWTDYGNGQRSVEGSDLTDGQLKLLAGVVDGVEDLALKARIADVLWTRKHGHKFARLAVEAYVADGVRHEDETNPERYLWRLERAASLAMQLGKGKALHQSVVARLDMVLNEFASDARVSLFLAPLCELILKQDVEEPARYAGKVKELASLHFDRGDWSAARDLWEQSSSWHHKIRDEEEARMSRLNAARAMVALGREYEEKRPGAGAGWLMRGLECMRNNGGSSDEIENLSLELVAAQKRCFGSSDFSSHAASFGEKGQEEFQKGIDECGASVSKFLSELSFEEAIVGYCTITEPTEVAALRELIRSQGSSSIQSFVAVVSSDEEGKEIDRADPMNFMGEIGEAALQKRMFMLARDVWWPLKCKMYLLPGLRAIGLENAPPMSKLGYLVADNPLIPPGHEILYLRGLSAGFEGDFTLSSHLLIPQLENSLREYLKSHQVVTWIMKDGLQKEIDLGGMLSSARTKELLGEDLVFDLRGILTEKFGFNLRNNMAHGKMAAPAFQTTASLYFWWLCLRMIWLGYDTGKKMREG